MSDVNFPFSFSTAYYFLQVLIVIRSVIKVITEVKIMGDLSVFTKAYFVVFFGIVLL